MDNQITLEAYGDEVNALIRNERNDEALAICKHILRYHPKHVDTYCQMGQVYLVQGDLDGAKDLFLRVLSADPENAVAHVGLADVFEQQNMNDEAVWHLERAYELAPSDPGINKELLRLHAQVDGRARPRLKLTSGALARLYVEQGLFSQAIQEFRAIVAAAPSRFDARIALAETLWHTGRMREAAEIAQNLLETLPYCLKANLFLGTAWKESGLPESDIYLQRAQELDPANRIAQQLLGARSPLPLNQVRIPRRVESAPSAITPPPVEQVPVPLAQPVPTEVAAPLVEPAPTEAMPEPSTQPVPYVSTLPTWMRAESAEPVEITEPTAAPSAKPTATGVSPLPPWLSEETLPAAKAKSMPPTVPSSPWIIEPIAAEKARAAQVEPSVAKTGEMPIAEREKLLPPWLRELQPEPTPIETTTAPEESAPIGEPREFPIWLEELRAQPTPVERPLVPPAETAPAEPAREVPTWLEESQAQPAAAETQPAPPVETAPAEPAREVPTWLEELQAQPATAETQPAPTVETTPAEPAREVPTWLEELQAQPATAETQPAPPVETAPAEPAREVPTWLEELQAQPALQAEIAPAPAPPEITTEPTGAEPTLIEAAPPIAVEMPEPAEPVAPKQKHQPKGYEHLILAREHRDAYRLDDELVEYDYVVQHAPRLVDEVIDDLQVLAQRSDMPLEGHRILGDAYTRVGRLADALERYNFALERVS